MLFNSISFLASFTVLTFVYYALPHRQQRALLLLASLGFYATFNLRYVLLLLGVTVVAYVGGRLTATASHDRRKKAIRTSSVVVILGTLFIFKDERFFVDSISELLRPLGLSDATPLLPRLQLTAVAGLSFYAFSCVSYVNDVYAGRVNADRRFTDFALFVSFFPKLLAGPIERAKPFLSQLTRPVSFNGATVNAGLQLMLWGLFKKVVIADRLSAFIDPVYRQPAYASPADLLIATYFFAFQLYCDFSGYSDMAIGAARILGIDLMDNFRRPYFSTSVSEFWSRRWHLSLTSWFRDYVYIPLGGNRVSVLRQCANIMAVFLLSGLWHGAAWTFVVWGGLNGLYLVVGRLSRPIHTAVTTFVHPPAPVRQLFGRVVTFHLILITWIFFRASSLSDAATILSRISASIGRLPAMVVTRSRQEDVLLSLALIASLLIIEAFDEMRGVWDWLDRQPAYLRWSAYYAVLLCLLVLGTWNFQQFVYMQF